jgi:inosine/xanthosine triphosphate pyrophosphatase family protein/diadenosine tetraphosphate (Ap4A) HIT family hydrolase
MLTLVTTNPAKYAPFAQQLERLRIELKPPTVPLPEIQTFSFSEALSAKARAAAELFGRPVLVDDAGVVLEAYRPFPGPLTSAVLRGLGPAGLQRLVGGLTTDSTMECHIGCWMAGSLRSWSGQAHGHLDFSHLPDHQSLLLSSLFVTDGATGEAQLLHRARALAALETGLFDLHLDTTVPDCQRPCLRTPAGRCPFCAELEGDAETVFSEMMGDRLNSRVVYEDEHFVIMPPLGEFMEGGLLLLSRKHLLSFADLPVPLFEHLERLMQAIGRVLAQRYGVPPLFFEHGPAPEWSKGVCCVDHAHINIFPAAVHLHPHLSERMSFSLTSLADLARLRRSEFGYLFIQENDGARRVYDGHLVPTQLVRRVITSAIGCPERWHWRDFPGDDKLLATFSALKGQIRL